MIDVEPCESLEVLLSGFVDGELSGVDRERVRQHLDECHRCALKVIAMNEIKRETAHIQFQDPPPEQWNEHSKGLFEATGRGVAWILYLVGGVLYLVLVASALWGAIVDREAGWKLALAGLLILAGTVSLFVAVLSQRLKARRTDRYRDIVR